MCRLMAVMDSIFAPEVVSLVVLGIALASVLACLRATALVLARRIAIHNLRVEAHRKHSLAMARINEIRAQKIMNV